MAKNKIIRRQFKGWAWRWENLERSVSRDAYGLGVKIISAQRRDFLRNTVRYELSGTKEDWTRASLMALITAGVDHG